MLAATLAGLTVRIIYSLWSTGQVGDDWADDSADIMQSSIQGYSERRRTRRQLEALADSLLERMQPVIDYEFNNLGENEKLAALTAVEDTLKLTRLNAAAVLAVDFRSSAFEETLRGSDPDRSRRAGLSEPGAALYDLLLTECAVYITNIAAGLPDFASAQARELLVRDTGLRDLIEEILRVVPRSSVPHSWGPGREDARFETKFIRFIVEKYSRLELFGVTSTAARRPYDLSLAYISLEVATAGAGDPGGNEAFLPQTPAAGLASSDLETSTRVEQLLRSHSAILVSGDAGSGKTTLLRWIALNAIGTLDGGGDDAWSGRVPFIVALRDYAEEALPNPEQFVTKMAPALGGAMPQGWVHRVLSEGRGLILVDGLDETTADRREEAHSWLDELMSTFPEASVLVTSRGTALTRTWKSTNRFFAAELQPMSYADLRSFIDHWHAAAASGFGNEQKRNIVEAKRGMLQAVRNRPALRSLCTSPLLAALICALHLEGGGSLPSNRMELYSTALDMLIMRRDNERKLGRTAGPQPTARERTILLQGFAQWLHENGLAICSRNDYELAIAHILPRLHQLDGSPVELGQFLLERCGILREPTHGNVDFVHRSFLEYLAAAALIDENSIQKLINNAMDDSWREVIVMAAGHANSAQRDALINGLLDRGQASAEEIYRCYAIAVACMQTTTALPAQLKERLELALAEIVPPTNMTDAAAVASAGEAAAPLLVARPQGKKLGVWEAVASVRALSLIGGPEALQALKTFGDESRKTVIRQLLRAWSSFDMATYADEVLRKIPLSGGKFICDDLDQLPHLQALEKVDDISLKFSEGVRSWAHLQPADGNPRIHSLELLKAGWVETFVESPHFENLRQITLRDCVSLTTLQGIDKYPNLSSVSVSTHGHSLDTRPLAVCQSLTALTLVGVDGEGLDWIAELERPLGQLVLSARSVSNGSSRAPLSLTGPPRTEALLVSGFDYSAESIGLSESSDITSLTIQNMRPDSRPVKLPERLQYLYFYYPEGNVHFDPDNQVITVNAALASAADVPDLIRELPNLLSLGLVSARDFEEHAEEISELIEASEIRTLNVPNGEVEHMRLAGWSRIRRRSYTFLTRPGLD